MAGDSLAVNFTQCNQAEEAQRKQEGEPQKKVAELAEEGVPPAKTPIQSHVVVVKRRSWCFCF